MGCEIIKHSFFKLNIYINSLIPPPQIKYKLKLH